MDPEQDRSMFYKPLVAQPNFTVCTHSYNNILLAISNFGLLGAQRNAWQDCETGKAAPSAQFPAGSEIEYLYAAALWVGAVVDQDTLVSVGFDGWRYQWELLPCSDPYNCTLVKSSSRPSDDDFSDSARADLEYEAVYWDTIVNQQYTGTDWEGRDHVPIGIEINQHSYSWSVSYASDFVLVDYRITNVSSSFLKDVYIGLYVDGDVEHVSIPQGHGDDLCGFRESYPSRAGHGFLDTINYAYIMDNDGDPVETAFDYQSSTSITGVSVMRVPDQNVRVSFNWWNSNTNGVFDWGPMLESTKRNYGTGGVGTPEGDRNKYYLMSNGEHDYDQIFAAEDRTEQGWLSPVPGAAAVTTRGQDTRYVLSAGPFDISASDTLSFTIAYVAGEDIHRDPSNYEINLKPDPPAPHSYYANLDFSDAAENCVWASWVYDNPGYDTDGDGYCGPFWEVYDTIFASSTIGSPSDSIIEIVIDTFYYKGDSIPDFRAATAPPPPVLRFNTTLNEVRLRWNGLITETSKDPFTHVVDFEGYRIYMGRLPTVDKLAMLAAHDRLNYTVFRWIETEGVFEPEGIPSTLLEIRQRFFEDLDPNSYPVNDFGTGLNLNGATYAFEKTGWNQSVDGWNDGAFVTSISSLRKRFAEEIAEGVVTPAVDSADANLWVTGYDPRTGDSVLYHKFYEYEYVIGDLLSSVPWYFSVTATDFGDYANDLEPLESSPLANIVEVWPVNDAAAVEERGLEVAVYPNPYIGDGRYAVSGYEDPNRTGFVDHERRIHFLNLPYECTIRIYTLDGDLVRKLHHPGNFSNADSKMQWDLRSTNNELVASGIYLFVVESRLGNQIGKFVIIL